MAGRIPDRDIAAIRERTRIEDIVGDYVQLKRAGADSLKGLCPFHDEKSPSFHVRPNHGQFHCFGCGEGGDAYTFIQKIEHISFVEAVERLADRISYTINYEGGGTAAQRDRGTRARLVAANAAAQEFYATALDSPEAAPARQYLTERNFDGAAAKQYGCGYAPSGWDTLTKHLMRKGFEFKELEAAGLSKEGRRGPIDRFHRRLLWPIRASSGEVIGFGARKIFDDDTMPGKYVNTPETMLYKKSSVLFGLDMARRDIAKGHQAVVVEGYTDVMAMHLAGVTTAVASCGTAFGTEHVSVIRRLIGDDSFDRGEVIYTFDGDAAGQSAAMKAFEGDQNFAAQTFVAVAPDGQDPCDLRNNHGDAAVKDLVARREPLFEFAIRTELRSHDLASAEGRVAALQRTVPLVAQIKREDLRDEYARRLAGWVGWDDIAVVVRRVRESAGVPPEGGRSRRRAPLPAPRRDDTQLHLQREALKAALQIPGVVGPGFDELPEAGFTHPQLAAVHRAIMAAGGVCAGLDGSDWLDAVVAEGAGDDVKRLVSELAVENLELPKRNTDEVRYVNGVLAGVRLGLVEREIADLKSQLQRTNAETDHDEYMDLFGVLVPLEQYKIQLREQASGVAS